MSTPQTHQAPDAGDIVASHWLLRHAPVGTRPYLKLARVDRPIGVWLLLFPCWWSLALGAADLALTGGVDFTEIIVLAVFFAIGAFVMRSAGCTFNDIIDRDFDGFETSVGYTYASAFGFDPDVDSPDDLRSAATRRGFHVVTARVSGTIELTQTEVTAVYRWAPGFSLTPVDPYQLFAEFNDPTLSLTVAQNLPSGGLFPAKVQAVVDARNLFERGHPFEGITHRMVSERNEARLRLCQCDKCGKVIAAQCIGERCVNLQQLVDADATAITRCVAVSAPGALSEACIRVE